MRNWRQKVALGAAAVVACSGLAACGDSGVRREAVVLYSNQAMGTLEELEKAFEKAHEDLDLQVVRLSDADLEARAEADVDAGKPVADVYVLSDQSWLDARGQEQWWADPAEFAAVADGSVPADAVAEGGYLEIASALLTFAWNTDRFSGTLTDYPDLLTEELAGQKIGVIEPTAPFFVDFYLWLEEKYGEDYLERLAALEPKVYAGALPMAEAIASGEIAATPYAAPSILTVSQGNGAPVKFEVGANGAWGVPYYSAIYRDAPNPKGAQALMDFMLTRDGQEIVAKDASSVLPDIASALASNDQMHAPAPDNLTPEAVAAFNERWDALFRSTDS